MLFENDRERIVAIVKGIEAGNSDDIERLHTFLRRGVMLILRNQKMFRVAEAEDLFSDAFLEVVTAISKRKIRTPESIAAFAVTIVHRRIVGVIKERMRERRSVEVVAAAEYLVAAPHGEHSVLSEERKEIMHTALAQLCAQDREILQRFYFLQQRPDLIQAEMRLTETQYRLLKSRAKAKLIAICQTLMTGTRRDSVARAMSNTKLSRLDRQESQRGFALCEAN